MKQYGDVRVKYDFETYCLNAMAKCVKSLKINKSLLF